MPERGAEAQRQVAGHAGPAVVGSSTDEGPSDLVAAWAVRPDLSRGGMPLLSRLNRAVPVLSAHRRGCESFAPSRVVLDQLRPRSPLPLGMADINIFGTTPRLAVFPGT
jgi:hypothetical protein